MASRQTPVYRRAVRSGLSSASGSVRHPGAATADGIWITDALLASSFERYCRLSPAFSASLSHPTLARNNTRHNRRFASNVPGPLENRRRLGKRQMTEQLSLQLSHHPLALPAWALPNAPDLRQWQWTAPRDVSSFLPFRQTEKGDARSGDGLQNGIQNATQENATSWTSVLPPLEIPRWLANLGESTSKEEVDPALEYSVDESKRRRSATSELLFTSLQAWEERVRNQQGTVGDEDAFGVQFHKICDEFQTQLRLAAVTADEAQEAFDALWNGVQTRRQAGDLVAVFGTEHLLRHRQHTETLYAAVLQGIADCHLLQAEDFGEPFWRRLLTCATEEELPAPSLSPPTRGSSPTYSCHLPATKTLLATPPQFVAHMADLLPAVLRTIFINADQGDNDSSTLATRIAETLRTVDLEQPQSLGLVQATTDLLLQHLREDIASNSSRITQSERLWVNILAHMPQVRQESLFQVLVQLQRYQQQPQIEGQPQKQYLDSMEISTLLLAQWKSRGYAMQEVLDSFRAAGYSHTNGAILSTAAANSAQSAEHGGAAQCLASSPVETSAVLGAYDADTEASSLVAAALAASYSRHGHQSCIGIFASLWTCLKMLGREAQLVSSVEALVARQTRLISSAREAKKAQEPTRKTSTPSSTVANGCTDTSLDTITAATAATTPTAATAGTMTLTKTKTADKTAILTKKLTLRFPPVKFFENLAYATNDLDVVLQLHALYMRDVRPNLPFEMRNDLWSIKSWSRFSDRLRARLDSGQISPGQVSHALDFDLRAWIQKQATTQNVSEHAKAKMSRSQAGPSMEKADAKMVALVENLAVHYALRPNLGHRQALRGVERCRAYLNTFAAPRQIHKPRAGAIRAGRNGQGRGGLDCSSPMSVDSTKLTAMTNGMPDSMKSPTVLRALFHVVTRDLDEMQPGRGARLQWLVNLVQKNYGNAAAASVGHALRRWRKEAVKVMGQEESQERNRLRAGIHTELQP